jgi:hypothetical protein
VNLYRLAGNWPRAVVAAIGVVLASCGSVGEPLPPLLHIPGRVADFTVRQEASQLIAEWTWPVLGSEGQIFREMERFEIYSLFIPPGGAIPGEDAFNDQGEMVATAAALASDATGPGTRLVAQAPLEEMFGSRRAFAVRGVSNRGRNSAWSQLRWLDIVQPPPAPADLQAVTIERGVSLTWNSAPDVKRYDLERRTADGEFVSIGQPASPEFLDESPQWGTPLTYRVKAFNAAGESPDVPGPPSSLAEITPRDTFAPATPSDLRALATDAGTELSWSSNTEPDLSGYRVSRNGSPLHDGLIDSANFSDQPLSTGQSAVYQVVAVDRSGNASAPAEVLAVSPR